MNDDVEQLRCPVCHRLIEVVLDWQGDEPDTGIRAGWFGGIAIEDTACFQHMTAAQIEATVDSAIIQREMRDADQAALEAEIARISAEEIDEMRRQSDWAHRLMDAVVNWHDDVPY